MIGTASLSRPADLAAQHMASFDRHRRIGDGWMDHLNENPPNPNDPADTGAFLVIADKALCAYRLALTHYSVAAQLLNGA